MKSEVFRFWRKTENFWVAFIFRSTQETLFSPKQVHHLDNISQCQCTSASQTCFGLWLKALHKERRRGLLVLMSMLSDLTSTAVFLIATQQTAPIANVCRVGPGACDRHYYGAAARQPAGWFHCVWWIAATQEATAKTQGCCLWTFIRTETEWEAEWSNPAGSQSLGRVSCCLRSKGISREAACPCTEQKTQANVLVSSQTNYFSR